MLLPFLLVCCGLLAAADPYDAWSQGRPAEAVAPLVAAARADGRWDSWLDAGLAAAAASDYGRAIACLAEANRAAPERSEPRDALRALGAALPLTYSERVGPIALPGVGWAGVALLGAAGLALGGAWALRRGRGAVLTAGVAAVVVAVPGVVAPWLDARVHWVATVRATHALDSTGAPLRALPAGTLLVHPPAAAWSGRVLVRLGDGSLAFVPAADLDPG
ncbi:MAG: hypothetical protein L6R48_25900 [Planctomycetes bacterium]|nr:hypothetical protein [Planctomycetota bacterium]